MRTPTIGATVTHTHTVSAAEAPAFDGVVVHEVYGTAFVVRDMERTARLALVPLLEAGEEGVGREVRVRHVAPTPFGRTVVFTATVTAFDDRTLTTEIVAKDGDRVIATGAVVQGIVNLERFRAAYAALATPAPAPAPAS